MNVKIDVSTEAPARAWGVTFAGTAVNLCLGILHAWSIWKANLVGDAAHSPGSPMSAPNEGLVLEGRLITGDAMFCQRDLSRRIVGRGGHYLWTVKENQPTLLADIRAALTPGAEEALSPPTAAHLARIPGHGDDPGQRARPS